MRQDESDPGHLAFALVLIALALTSLVATCVHI